MVLYVKYFKFEKKISKFIEISLDDMGNIFSPFKPKFTEAVVYVRDNAIPVELKFKKEVIYTNDDGFFHSSFIDVNGNNCSILYLKYWDNINEALVAIYNKNPELIDTYKFGNSKVRSYPKYNPLNNIKEKVHHMVCHGQAGEKCVNPKTAKFLLDTYNEHAKINHDFK